ncbi:hypothetical protein [Synechococcus sp. PCC 6312]|uniref:hypothetical protein n=1 Tax=Synechococcus sp. (strain ATCC 27167 / PCC 6312) TaxID=195253 RepID=UPI00029EC6CF|nr:hypothetical protein [Synechococcus sp. PCC 6312]AFY61845.1 hypothetical protein Syn6312_2765 [Synechococcus sp. PCC 6312]
MRGGQRKGAGRKSSWKNRETSIIRVPTIIAQQLLEIAHELDKNYPIEQQLSILDVLRRHELNPKIIHANHPNNNQTQKQS